LIRISFGGSADLPANYTVTGGIQTGTIRQSTLLPFAAQHNRRVEMPSSPAANLAQLS